MEDYQLKIKVGTLYYKHNLSKIEIGEKLRISRFKVAKLLEDALREGIVKIHIAQPENTYFDIETDLEKKFNLYRATVVEAVEDYAVLKKNCGIGAARCLRDIVYEGDNIGIAWGTTIYELINALPESIDTKDISVVQITGGLNQVETKFNAIELSSKLAKVFHARCFQLYAPAIVDCVETREMLFNDSSIKRTLDMFSQVNIAIVGIGSIRPKPSTLLYQKGFLNDGDIEKIVGSCAVGDINTCFYADNGSICKSGLDNRTIGMNLEQLKRVRYRMGIAGGKFKFNAIKAALKGKIINILVTDCNTAQKLLKQ